MIIIGKYFQELNACYLGVGAVYSHAAGTLKNSLISELSQGIVREKGFPKIFWRRKFRSDRGLLDLFENPGGEGGEGDGWLSGGEIKVDRRLVR